MKFLFRPVKPFIVNQLFGENGACISLDGKRKVIACNGNNPPVGYTSVYGLKGHQGIDLRAYLGQAVYCSYEGMVVSIDTQERSGLDVRIVSELNGTRYMHIYEHLSGINALKVGDRVKTGECIGWAGSTGLSSAVHLHFELKVQGNDSKWTPINPVYFVNEFFAPDADKVKAILESMIVVLENLFEKLRKR